MKADFSRFTFDPTLNVRSVLIQQGRPLDDASLNEGTEALLRRTETEAVDVIGAEGAPLKGGGFRVVKAWADLTADEKADPRNANPGVNATYLLTAGRFYVDGLQVENHAIAVGNLPITGKRLLYLRAIVDHQTGVEMPRVLDPALGDADTATRAVVRWRVGALNAANMGACGDTNADWDALIASPAGKMTVTLNQAAPSSDPCKLTPGGGYARPENLLYRVEVHDGTPGANPQPDDGPRFMRENLKVKLSRNNGMEVAKITAVSGNDSRLSSAVRSASSWQSVQ